MEKYNEKESMKNRERAEKNSWYCDSDEGGGCYVVETCDCDPEDLCFVDFCECMDVDSCGC